MIRFCPLWTQHRADGFSDWGRNSIYITRLIVYLHFDWASNRLVISFIHWEIMSEIACIPNVRFALFFQTLINYHSFLLNMIDIDYWIGIYHSMLVGQGALWIGAIPIYGNHYDRCYWQFENAMHLSQDAYTNTTKSHMEWENRREREGE